MKIAENTVVDIEYRLYSIDGELMDSSDDEGVLTYHHGTGAMMPGLEDFLEGKEPGFDGEVTLEAEDAFGERDDELMFMVSRDDFPDPDDVEPGMEFDGEIEGEEITGKVLAVEGDQVWIDANHPLAGSEVRVEVTVIDVRSVEEELGA